MEFDLTSYNLPRMLALGYFLGLNFYLCALWCCTNTLPTFQLDVFSKQPRCRDDTEELADEQRSMWKVIMSKVGS